MCNKKQLIKDLIILGVCMIATAIFSATVGKSFMGEFLQDFNLSLSGKTFIIFTLFLGYAVAGYITGFQVIKKHIDGLLGIIIAFLCGHIVGFIFLPVRIIKNAIFLIVELFKSRR